MRRRFCYFTPDEYYEALLARLVREDTLWLDVGCGCELLPKNDRLATVLAGKCKLLVGVDPDAAVKRNPFTHSYFHGAIEDFDPPQRFNLITLRMVAEHITNPEAVVKALKNLLEPSGIVVVYTVNRWAIVPIATTLLPFRLHHPIKKILWGTIEEETFPTHYRMNTRQHLTKSFGRVELKEVYFTYLDDCRSFARFKWLHFAELSLWCALKRFGFNYLDNCLLGVYGND